MPDHRSAPRLLAALCAAALLVACGDDGGADGATASPADDELELLRGELDGLRDDNRDLEDQLVALREDLGLDDEDPEDGDPEDPLSALDDALEALAARVDELTATRPDRDATSELAAEAASDEVSDVRRALDEVREAAERARGEIDELRTLYDVLRERVDRIDERT